MSIPSSCHKITKIGFVYTVFLQYVYEQRENGERLSQKRYIMLGDLSSIILRSILSFDEMVAFGCRAINYLWSVDVYLIIVLKTLVFINYNNYVYYWRSHENVSNYIYILRVERTNVFRIKKKKKKWYNTNDIIRWNNCFCAY